MKFLFDTNIVIPAEPTSLEDLEPGTDGIVRLLRLLGEAGFQVLVHPDTTVDLSRDPEPGRRAMRATLLKKYAELRDPPDIPAAWAEEIGAYPRGSNDWVDCRLLAALAANAVHFFVTEDQRLSRKARRLGLSRRVLTVDEALVLVESLSAKPSPPSPPARSRRVYSLDQEDPIFVGLRADYEPGFDAWLRMCCATDRDCWVIQVTRTERRIAGLCIIKPETDSPFGLPGKVLKLCTFKVADEYSGRRELLLKTAFRHVAEKGFDSTYLTVFEKHDRLIALLEDFGFRTKARSTLGELVMAKQMRPNEASDSLSPLEFHVTHGPPAMRWSSPAFIVPIEPRFHHRLFPDVDAQGALDAGAHASGNAIRKAYLCKAALREIPSGSPLLFYASREQRAVTVLGVAEQTLRSSSPEKVATFVGKRTVYSMKDIEGMCAKGRPILAVLFRQDRPVSQPLGLKELITNGVMAGPPQSIVRIQEKTSTWVQKRLGL